MSLQFTAGNEEEKNQINFQNVAIISVKSEIRFKTV
jgi:hypothetical protein